MSEYGAPLPLLARYAVMVDVGYIFAAGGELLLGTSSRRDFRVDAVPLIQAISKHADELVRGELLRVYWYDAARDRVPTIDQRVIAQLPLVKLRLGNLNARGQQKGVDAQIRADMEALARHHAITDAVLVAGDEDMVPAVEAALKAIAGVQEAAALIQPHPSLSETFGETLLALAGRGLHVG